METTLQHCPGFERHRNLESCSCECPNCGNIIEIFSDEFDKQHYCKGCDNKIDGSKLKQWIISEHSKKHIKPKFEFFNI